MRMRMFGWRAMCALAVAASVSGTAAVHADDGQPQLKLNKVQQRLLSGFADLQLNGAEVRTPRAAASRVQSTQRNDQAGDASELGNDPPRRPFYFPTEDDLCPQDRGSNVRVNQDCQNVSDPDLPGRGQAQNETAINYDPNNRRHLVSTFNDYRRGDGNCGGAFSLDGGQNWADIVVPMSFTRAFPFFNADPTKNPSREYWTSGGDTSVAFDTKGNAYFSCQVFNRGKPTTTSADQSSAMLVFRSTGNAGASWNFPGRYVTAINSTVGDPFVFEDKQLLTVDNHPGSPFQDRVYVSWTEFTADGTAYIWLAYSADYGETFSARHLVSLNSSTLCTNTYGLATPEGTCNENQFSQPFTGPDGALYVVYNNFNNSTSTQHGNDGTGDGPLGAAGVSGGAADSGTAAATLKENRNQVLLSRSTDGGNTFVGPVKVADYYELPDCATYQGGKDPDRACVPEKGSTHHSYFRATNYGSGSVNPSKPHQVVISFGSYINRYSNEKRPNPCIPTGFAANGDNLYLGVKTPDACNNKILLSVSNDAGMTFTGTTTDPRALPTVNQAPRQQTTDQWFQWLAFTPDARLAVSYYDRQYGTDETTGFSDFSLSGTRDLDDPLHVRFATRRATTSSLPPPTQFGGAFWGDYTGLSAPDRAYPTWSDTRNPELVVCPGTALPGVPPKVCSTSAANADLANDQDAFTRGMPIPLPDEDDQTSGDNS